MKKLKIGTRGSPLALIQTKIAIEALETHHPFLKGNIEIIPIKTTGDVIVDRSLVDIGGKSLFTKEIEDRLLGEEIDIAIHSMKDVAAIVPAGLTYPAVLEGDDPRDVVVTRGKKSMDEIPEGSLFGTSSLRREAYLHHRYPHFQVASLRGNVNTRLKKIAEGEYEGAIFAYAGLKRLNLLEHVTQVLSVDDCLPAVAQGVLGIQCREGDQRTVELLTPLNHIPTFQRVTAERAFLKTLEGSCRTPIAGYARHEREVLSLRGMYVPKGGDMQFVTHHGPVQEAERIGIEAAQLLKSAA